VYKEFDEEVINYRHFMGSEAFVTETKAHFQHMTIDCESSASIGFNKGVAFTVNLENGNLNLGWFKPAPEFSCKADDYMIYDGRIYYKNFDDIYEVMFLGDKAVSRHVGQTMENATKMFPGVSIQNMLGKFVASVFPSSQVCYQISLDQLKGYKVVEAKYENDILVVIASKKGKYDRFIFTIENNKIVSERKVEDITNTGINFVALDKGIAVLINEEDKVEIFAKSNVNKIKLIEDSQINGNMRLFAQGSQVLFTGGNKVYTLTMK
jgi:hypothetical protein